MHNQKAYDPVFEDWMFHVVVPVAAYGALLFSAFTGNSQVRTSLFVVGASALLLLFAGIHNAWDAVTYHVFVRKQESHEAEQSRTATD